ncbi:MAG TPA: hypothetical protein VH276_15965 [Solirubrobacteraceae bacterium]|nr:hypothetical protein [Solirubrobacteraceae bacterium]
MLRPIRVFALLAVLAGLIAVAGCGQSEESAANSSSSATSEGTYLELDRLKYQVQMSRYLNPHDMEDAAYLRGLPSGLKLGKDEIWFAVFMRVENDGDKTGKSSGVYEITDTENNVFRPVPLDSKRNDFVYRPQTLEPSAIIPSANSIAGQGVIQGSLLLFKLKEADLQNRPLTLRIGPPSGGNRTVELDL